MENHLFMINKFLKNALIWFLYVCTLSPIIPCRQGLSRALRGILFVVRRKFFFLRSWELLMVRIPSVHTFGVIDFDAEKNVQFFTRNILIADFSSKVGKWSVHFLELLNCKWLFRWGKPFIYEKQIFSFPILREVIFNDPENRNWKFLDISTFHYPPNHFDAFFFQMCSYVNLIFENALIFFDHFGTEFRCWD